MLPCGTNGAARFKADAAHLVGWRRLQLQYEVGRRLVEPLQRNWTPATQLGRCILCGGVFG